MQSGSFKLGGSLGFAFCLFWAVGCGDTRDAQPSRLAELERMTFVPAGEVRLGGTSAAFLARTKTSLLVDRFEARWADFETWGMPGKAGDEAEFPGTTDWPGARDFAASRGMRLPTVSEWLYTATGGLAANTKPRVSAANTLELGLLRTAPVGAFESGRGPFGTYDQVGNVWEWTADHVVGMGLNLGSGAGLDVAGQIGMRTAIGGSYLSLSRPLLEPGGLLPVFGQSLGPGHRAPDLGVRCVAGAREWLAAHAVEIPIEDESDRERLLGVGKQWAEAGAGQLVVLLEALVSEGVAGNEVIELLLKGARS